MSQGESFADFSFPQAGLDLSRAYGDQRPKPMPGGAWGRTTRFGLNVRSYEPGTERSRGGSRPGLVKHLEEPVVADWLVQDLALVVGTYTPGGSMQLSQSGRVVSLVAVSQGNVYSALAGDDAWTLATNSTGFTLPLNFTGLVYSTSLNQKLYFADGVHYVYFDPEANTVQRLLASAGALPEDAYGNLARLCCTWRGRLVFSGLLRDPHNVFLSAVGDPTDWNYFPDVVTATQAVAFNSAPIGLVGDVVTTLIPYTDDVLLIGGDHSIYMLQGDPMAGGQLDLVSHSVGMAWGVPWAMDPYSTVYFVSNNCGIYMMVPGQKPQRISQPIEQLVSAYNTGQMVIRLVWNDKYQGLHCFFTFASEPATTTHLFWEMRTGGWWLDRFANVDHNPVCCCVFDGNLPEDRAALIGCWDGYVRSLSGAAEDDDGATISSSVLLGPLNTKELDELLFKTMQAVLGEDSEEVEYEVYTGATAEAALSRAPVSSGTWGAGRNLTNLVRRAGHALYVKITSTSPWSLEQVRVAVAGTGKVRQRGH